MESVAPLSPKPFPELLAQFRAAPRSLLNAGVYLYDKPSGITSHDVVARVKRQRGWKKVGHGGTLDPLATGLLVILVDGATRLFDALHEFDKEYLADFRLGLRTDSQDITGKIIAETAAFTVRREQAAQALRPLHVEILQVPPMFSSLKQQGRKLVDLARRGIAVERAPRPVKITVLELLHFDGRDGRLRVAAGKGFYARTLIDDFGTALGVGATLTALRRTRVAMFGVEEAIPF
ncbi:hypothetical protein FACS1894107_17300 [Planctomycetales bacterium]|nr:hypothetical protein FACS1894107_17300 [Planctomycetales bacterium]